MKNIIRILIYPLIVMGFLLIFTNSCQKDETTSKKDPVITWENPGDITYGTLLSETQLNATANVPGTFVHTPGLGTKLNEGTNQDLKVDFTPTDLATYNSASKTVKINVTKGTGNGGTTSAVFNQSKIYGTITDIDGNEYKTIIIGSQTWMAENIRTTHYQNGEAIFERTDETEWGNLSSGAYCNYRNTRNADTIATYGRLYNWFTIADNRNIAPTGWHVPSDVEWTALMDYLGGDNVAGGKLKEEGTTHWNIFNAGATNETGFTALPGGFCNFFGAFKDIGSYGIWWSTTEDIEGDPYRWYICYEYSDVDRLGSSKTAGYSVRCLKN
jgi:uncharacterized protein (TIGR02145 family)